MPLATHLTRHRPANWETRYPSASPSHSSTKNCTKYTFLGSAGHHGRSGRGARRVSEPTHSSGTLRPASGCSDHLGVGGPQANEMYERRAEWEVETRRRPSCVRRCPRPLSPLAFFRSYVFLRARIADTNLLSKLLSSWRLYTRCTAQSGGQGRLSKGAASVGGGAHAEQLACVAAESR